VELDEKQSQKNIDGIKMTDRKKILQSKLIRNSESMSKFDGNNHLTTSVSLKVQS